MHQVDQGCPRTRGGACSYGYRYAQTWPVSPYARGCLGEPMTYRTTTPGVPVRAGVLGDAARRGAHQVWCPRTRGGAWGQGSRRRGRMMVSPYARGCLGAHGGRRPLPRGVPVRAGVLGLYTPTAIAALRCPRTRGGAWYPASLSRTVRQVSPYARGCLEANTVQGRRDAGVPVRAGVLGTLLANRCKYSGCPRTRGGAWKQWGRLAPARTVSPHARGCLWRIGGVTEKKEGVPARAGVLEDYYYKDSGQ